MKMKISVLLVILLITTFFSKTFSTEDPDLVCRPLEDDFYTYCRNDDVLTAVTSKKPVINNPFNTTVITDEIIVEISDNAFNHSLQIENLTLNFNHDLLHLNPNAFNGLDNLTVLNINKGRVVLRNDAFAKLTSLQSLKIETDESEIRLNKFIPNLKNLTELEILRAWEITICRENDGQIHNLPAIKRLYYSFGRIAALKNNSFTCLNNIIVLKISHTHLTVIEKGTFDGLEKLEKLVLTMNKKFKKISVGIFNNFVNSIELDLHNNSIEVIEAEAFDSKINHFISIDLSLNKLKNITTDTFYGVQSEVLNLSSNNILEVERYSFVDSKILNLLLFGNPSLQFDDFYLEMSIYTIISGLRSNIVIKIPVNADCTVSKDEIFKICDEESSLMLVREIKSNNTKRNNLSISTLEISKNITSIEEYTFYNLSMRELVIKSQGKNLIIIKPKALYLPKLEILKFHGPSISLAKNIFKKLTSLRFLTSKVDEKTYLLCQLLPELINIKYLTIVDHDKINICDEKCYNNKLKLINLEYLGGIFTEVQAYAFKCIDIRDIAIRYTNLLSINVDAFIGLENLKSLSLTENKYLTHIPSHIFNNLKQLYVLVINNFYITRLDSKIENALSALKFNENMVLISLNENKIIHSVGGSICHASWKDIVVSSNEIVLTSNAEDYTKKRTHIFLYNTTESEDDNPYKIMSNQTRKLNSCWYKSLICINSKIQPTLKICINKNGALDSVENTNPSVSIRKFELDIGCIESIGQFAFINSTIENELSIKSYVKKLKIAKNAFSYLKNLKSLRFIDSVVRLDYFIFRDLQKLDFLKLSFDDTIVPLCNIFTDVSSLSTLEVINHNNVNICNDHRCTNNGFFEIKKLWYNGGAINEIKKKSFRCVTLLNVLYITHTNLTTIESEAFYGLSNLEILSLAENKINFISKYIFQHLKKLKMLFLQFNNIQEIEGTPFELMNANLIEVNLDVNQLSIIKKNTFNGLRCDRLYLSSNNIHTIEDDAFNNSYIHDLYYFNNPKISIILEKIGLSNFTALHYDTESISVLNQQPKTYCKLLCENCDIICETTASKLARNIENQENINIHSFDKQKARINEHPVKHNKTAKKCTKYCENCPLIC